jgi:hypothetical protein
VVGVSRERENCGFRTAAATSLNSAPYELLVVDLRNCTAQK